MKTVIKYLAFLCILVLINSCNKSSNEIVNPDFANKGSIGFTLNKSTIPTEVKIIVAKLERYGFPAIQDSILVTTLGDTVNLVINNIPIGNWSLTLTAKDSLGKTKYTGSAMVTIYQDQVTYVYVTMNPTGSGTGTLNISIIWHTSKWTMFSGNPIVRQTVGTYDEFHNYIQAPCVVKVGSEYKMWYLSGDNSIQKIALATSSDGKNWSKYGIVLSNGTPGSWTERGVTYPSVIYESGVYKMWFSGKSVSSIHSGIGYATSINGVNWEVHPAAVIPSTFERPLTFKPTVVKKEGEYYLYYSVELTNGLNPKIYLAKSTDGINWTQHGIVLQCRSELNWERGGVFGNSVFFDGSKFIMFYTSKSNPNYFDMGYIGKAVSANGVNWTFSSTEPELRKEDTAPWFSKTVGFPFVMSDNLKLKVWFSAISDVADKWQIGYAEQ